MESSNSDQYPFFERTSRYKHIFNLYGIFCATFLTLIYILMNQEKLSTTFFFDAEAGSNRTVPENSSKSTTAAACEKFGEKSM